MRHIRKHVVTALVTLWTLAALAGCGSSGGKEQAKGAAPQDRETSTETSAAAAADDADTQSPAAEETAYPLEITDSSGEIIRLEQEPQRIVSVAPNLTEMLCRLEASDLLAGRSDYCDYPPEVLEIESVGSITTPDMEKLISLSPDIVLVSTLFDEENTQKLRDLGIPVIALQEEADVEGVYGMIETLGIAVNRQKEASECIRAMREEIKETEGKVKDLDAPSVYYVVGYGEYGDFTAGGDTFIGTMIEMAKGDNIAKDISGWGITLEEIIERDPSIIVIPESMKEDFMASPNYSVLTAVKEGKVYSVDENLLNRQGYRNAQGIRALAEIFHPEAFESK